MTLADRLNALRQKIESSIDIGQTRKLGPKGRERTWTRDECGLRVIGPHLRGVRALRDRKYGGAPEWQAFMRDLDGLLRWSAGPDDKRSSEQLLSDIAGMTPDGARELRRDVMSTAADTLRSSVGMG